MAGSAIPRYSRKAPRRQLGRGSDGTVRFESAISLVWGGHQVSRTFWVAVGAIGGIYAYRRGQRALDDARERGLVGNVQVAAEAAASVAQGTSRLMALANGKSAAPIVVDYPSAAAVSQRVQVTPVRRTPIRANRLSTPATAMKLDALDRNSVIDLRELQRATG